MGYLLSLYTLGTYLLSPPLLPLLPLSFPSLAPVDYEMQEMLKQAKVDTNNMCSLFKVQIPFQQITDWTTPLHIVCIV